MAMESVNWKAPTATFVIGAVACTSVYAWARDVIAPKSFADNFSLSKTVACTEAHVDPVTLKDKTKQYLINMHIVNPKGGDVPYAVAGVNDRGDLISGTDPIDSSIFNADGSGTAKFLQQEQNHWLLWGTNATNPIVLARDVNGNKTIARCPQVPLVGEPVAPASIPPTAPAATPTK